MDNRAYWIWLQQALGYGVPKAEQLLNSFGWSAEAVYRADRDLLRRRGLLNQKQLEALAAYTPEKALQVLEDCDRIGCQAIVCTDPRYPMALRQIYSRPLVLYVLGSLSCLEGRPAIGMVGTRRCSDYGRNVADLLSRQLTACGAVVVSGMAAGIDTVAHTGALKSGGKTVAVLGCGVDIAYPPQNDLLKDLIAQNGAVVSEFPPGTQPQSTFFPIRNRVISGLSQGVVVVEGRRRSGSLITAGHALAQGRDVFAVPGSVFESGSVGPHWLIAQGAIPVTCTRDILEEYLSLYPDTIDTKILESLSRPQAAPKQEEKPAEPAKPAAKKQKKAKAAPPPAEPADLETSPASAAPSGPDPKPEAPLFLSDLQRQVYGLMEAEPRSVDTLTQMLSLPAGKVLSALTQLEIYGLVEAKPGRSYVYSKEK